MSEKHFIVATAGHVDHGKSALVKALTGTDPDRLPEEKAREITIDLGFAHLDLARHSASEASLSVSIIDVPGHENFVRNMIAGLGSIDLALLVVAADDGWMPQTEEHVQILGYLGVSRMVVAVNKADAADPGVVRDQVRQQLQTTGFAQAPIVTTSARANEGLTELKQVIARTLENAMPQRDIGKPRLFIDRVFNLAGIGSVVTGTLSGGIISAGQSALLQPDNFKTRIRSIQSHRANIQTAHPGMRAGVNLSEVPKNSRSGALRRGCILTTEPFEPTSTIDVLVERSARALPSAPAARAVKSGTNVYFHHGTARVGARLILARDVSLGPSQCEVAQLRLGSPILAFTGDRFVLRDRSEQYTIAGGIILDPHGAEKTFRNADQQRLLTLRSQDASDLIGCVESQITRDRFVPLGALLVNSNFSREEIGAAANELVTRGRLVIRSGIAASAGLWQTFRQRVIDLVDSAHKTKPQQQGMDLSELRASIPQLSQQTTHALIEDLCATGFVRRGSTIARASHRATLPAQLDSGAKQILVNLSLNPFDPPGRAKIAVDENQRQALRYLIDQGAVIEVGSDVLMLREAFDRATEIVVESIDAGGPSTVSELREKLRTSRRVAVPLLERLDRDRITRRVGDRRVLSETVLPRRTETTQTHHG